MHAPARFLQTFVARQTATAACGVVALSAAVTFAPVFASDAPSFVFGTPVLGMDCELHSSTAMAFSLVPNAQPKAMNRPGAGGAGPAPEMSPIFTGCAAQPPRVRQLLTIVR